MFKGFRIQNLARILVFLILLGVKTSIAADLSQNKGTVTYTESSEMTFEQLKTELVVYQNDHSISGLFTQNKWIKELKLNLKSEGSFRVIQQKNKPAFIVWNILKPDILNVCISGSELYIKTMNMNKSEIIQQNLSDIEASDPTGMAKLHALIVIDPETIYKKFKVSKSKNTLILKNKDLKDGLGQIKLTLNNQKIIQTVEVVEVGDDKLTINFLKIKKEKVSQSAANEMKCDDILKK